MTKRLRSTESVPSLAGGLLKKWDHTGENRERTRVVSAWRSIAGEQVFSHARGMALRGGELLVYVDTPIWANELSALSEHYRVAINEHLGKEAVTSIRFTVSRKVEESARIEAESAPAEPQRDRVAPVPLTEEEREAVVGMGSAIKDETLRESVVSAAIAHFEWRKGIEARNAAEKAAERARNTSKNLLP